MLNWSKYQPQKESVNTSDTNQTPTTHQPVNTYTRIKNKEYKNNNILASDDAGIVKTDTNRLIGLFEPINPEFNKFYSNKTERKALEEMVEKYTYQKMENLLNQLPSIVVQQYAPSITSPSQLQKKMGALLQFLAKQKSTPQSKSAIYKEEKV